MSWMPSADPVLGDKRSCDALELVVVPRARDLPRIPGLYAAFAFASRGLAWTLLAAELLASELEGEPLPLEGDLVDAIDPGRFALQRLRRGRL